MDNHYFHVVKEMRGPRWYYLGSFDADKYSMKTRVDAFKTQYKQGQIIVIYGAMAKYPPDPKKKGKKK